MKKLILFCALMLAPLTMQAATWAHVADCFGSNVTGTAVASVTCTFGSSVSTTQLIAGILYGGDPGSAPTMTASDASSSSYQYGTRQYPNSSYYQRAFWSCSSAASGTFVLTGNFSPNMAFVRIAASAYSGNNTGSSCLDIKNQTTGDNNTPLSPSLTTTVNGDLAIGVSGNQEGGTYTSPCTLRSNDAAVAVEDCDIPGGLTPAGAFTISFLLNATKHWGIDFLTFEPFVSTPKRRTGSVISGNGNGPGIMCIGDSITNGYNTSPPVVPCLQFCVDVTTSKCSGALNEAQNGATTALWVGGSTYLNQAISDAAKTKITRAIVMLGTNDDVAGVSQATYTSNQQSMIAALEAAGFTHITLNYSPYLNPADGPPYDNTLLLEYQTAIGIMAAADPTHVFVGDTTAWTYFMNNLSQLQADGVHPTSTGATNLAQFWATAF